MQESSDRYLMYGHVWLSSPSLPRSQQYVTDEPGLEIGTDKTDCNTCCHRLWNGMIQQKEIDRRTRGQINREREIKPTGGSQR